MVEIDYWSFLSLRGKSIQQWRQDTCCILDYFGSYFRFILQQEPHLKMEITVYQSFQALPLGILARNPIQSNLRYIQDDVLDIFKDEDPAIVEFTQLLTFLRNRVDGFYPKSPKHSKQQCIEPNSDLAKRTDYHRDAQA